MVNLEKVNLDNVGFLRFADFGKKMLLTNDIGDYITIDKDDFEKFITGALDKDSSLYRELKSKNFIYSEIDKDEMVERFRAKNKFLWRGPNLHIIVVTRRCNQKCVYCQTSAVSPREKKMDMTRSTSQKTVDLIFNTPADAISIEFQGGEPLLNWNEVKFICSYAIKKNETHKKNVLLTIVTNLSLMDKTKLDFLVDNKVTICTSLDGPQKIHDANRKMYKTEASSYAIVTAWIKKIMARYPSPKDVGALTTLTRLALDYPKQIIDEYIRWGFGAIHLRPLSNFGFSEKAKGEIGYSAKEFISFYTECLDYLISLNKNGKTTMNEAKARFFLTKILLGQDPNFLDLRSPCGAGIGQLVYNYDGHVYTCDEARMLGSDAFVIGDVMKDSYSDIVSHPRVSSVCVSSVLEGLYCEYCAYKPYCGVCPVCNYKETGNLYCQMGYNEQCKINKGILDYLFRKLEDKNTRKIFFDWVTKA